MSFYSAYRQGFARVAACTVPVALADPATNVERIMAQARACDADSVALAVFPELSLSGYALDDLFGQDALLDAVDDAIVELALASADLLPVIVVGAPLRRRNRLYNCAVVIHRGNVLGVVPKSYPPTYREFYEARWFAAGVDQRGSLINRPHWPGGDEDGDLPFGPDLVFHVDDVEGLSFHVEVCEDVWVPVPPSQKAALAGASVLVNLSASPITVGRAQDRHLMARSASARGLAAYVYAAASPGESSTDLSWDGMTMVYELGELLGQSERFPDGPRRTVVDIDLDRIRQERLRQGTFDDNRVAERVNLDEADVFRPVGVHLHPPQEDIGLRRSVPRFPFVPDDADRLALDCYEAYNIQVSALEQRLRAIAGERSDGPKVVIGVSGGLDSTHALIVAARAMDRLGRPRTDVIAYTLPGFATSAATKATATALATALGVTFREVDIRPLAGQLLQDIGHPAADGQPVYDVAFENVQAGARTDLLFRAAGHEGGIVLGTGDLSELALGWCTYGVGDQMSHYAVNAGVPKTLIQHLIRWVIAAGEFDDEVGRILQQVLDTEISPELVPVAPGERPQSTQDAIGPYALHDFALFHVLRYGLRPSKIAFLAWHAWHDAQAGAWPPGYPDGERTAYDLATIRRWLAVFLQRFFGFSQFKRSAIPNGPKVLAGGSLSPRGDWRAPSDSSALAWLAELEANVPPA